MSATGERALLEAVRFDDAMALVDERTLRILDRRRATRRVRRRGWLIRRALLLADVLGLAFSFFFAQLIFGGGAPVSKIDPQLEFVIFLLSLPMWVIVAKLYGLYDHDEERTDHSTVDDVVPVFHLVTVGAWIFFASTWLTGLADPDVPRLLTFWAFAVVLVSLSRAVSRGYCRRQELYLQNTVIVGAGDVGQLVAKKFLAHPEYGINLVGFVDAEPKERRDDLDHIALLGPPDRLPDLVSLLDVERVVIAFTNESHDDVLGLIRSLKNLDVQVDIVPRLFEIVGSSVGIHTVEGLPLMGLPSLNLSRSSKFVKRLLDVVLSAGGLLALSPLLAWAALRIRLDSPGPILFRQTRMGEGGREFTILKFRTMITDADKYKDEVAHLNMHAGEDPRMFKVPDDPRVTKVGTFLRRYSLDELPQLWNVLRGDMSLVGPRPLILDEDRWVRAWARERLNLKPGVTGPWQVLGGSEIPFEEMVKLDYLYVTSWSPYNDLKLVFKTIPALFRVRSAY